MDLQLNGKLALVTGSGLAGDVTLYGFKFCTQRMTSTYSTGGFATLLSNAARKLPGRDISAANRRESASWRSRH